MQKEALARIKINKLLEQAGRRLMADYGGEADAACFVDSVLPPLSLEFMRDARVEEYRCTGQPATTCADCLPDASRL